MPGVVMALVACLILSCTQVHAAGHAAPLTAAGALGVYIAHGDSASLTLVRQNGAIAATRYLGATPTGLALDGARNLLYVAQQSSRQILVLRGADLQLARTLAAVPGATSLSAVAGTNALYLFDPSSQRTLLLRYAASGAQSLTPIYRTVKAPRVPQLHIVLDHLGSTGAVRATYWASGFMPGESVSVSWGASNQGIARADSLGLVSGSLPGASAAHPGAYQVGMYGLRSHRVLTRVVDTRPVHPRRAVRYMAPIPLVLGALPGPTVTATPPWQNTALRVPVSASAGALAPLAGIWLLLRRRKARRRARRSARGKAKRR